MQNDKIIIFHYHPIYEVSPRKIEKLFVCSRYFQPVFHRFGGFQGEVGVRIQKAR